MIAGALLALAAVCAPGAVAAEGLRAEIASVGLVEGGSESAVVDIVVEAESGRSVRVRSFGFNRLTVNGMPAYIAPAHEAVELPAGKRVRLGPFRATLYFRDMPGLEPLQALVREARVRIVGTLRAEIELDGMARLAMGSAQAVMWHAFDEALEVKIPGGRLGALSARALLAAAAPLVKAGLELRRGRERWRDRTWERSAELLAAVRSTYAYVKAGQAPVRVEKWATGIRVSPGRILVPLEAIEPWRFEPATALALQRGELRLAAAREVEVLLPEGGGRPAAAYRLSRAELRVVSGKCETERVLARSADGKTRKTKVCRGAGPGDLAMLEIVNPTAEAFQPWTPALPEEGRPLEVAVLRLVGEPGRSGRWWEIVRMEGERREGAIRLAEPIDAAALGSPMLLEGIPAGLVQHEYGGELLPAGR